MVAGLGYEVVQIEATGTLDGGDVMKVGDVVYVGLGGRTNAEGINQLAAFVRPAGWHVVRCPVTNVLHLQVGASLRCPTARSSGWLRCASTMGSHSQLPADAGGHGAHVVALRRNAHLDGGRLC